MNTVKEKTGSGFFRGWNQWYNKEYDVLLPIFYRDCSSMSVIYTASTKLVKPYIPVDDLHLLEIFPGRCLVTVSAFEYRDSDLGPYNEFSIAVPVSQGKKPLPLLPVIKALMQNRFHVFILNLPVTSERARRGGVELGGYPKFLADIRFGNNSEGNECSLSLNNNHILTLRGRNLKTSAHKQIRYVIYTCLNGCLVNNNMFINPGEFAQSMSRTSAVIETGSGHAIGDFLASIKLGKKPLVYQSIPSFEAILCATKNIADD